MDDLVAWFTDTRVLGIVFCAACITVLRTLSVADESRDQTRRRKLR